MGRTLYHRVEPRLARQARYAFLVHPRNLADVRRLYPETATWSDDDLAAALDETGPLILALISSDRGIDGVVVGAPFDPSMLRKDFRLARTKVRATAEFVGQLGVRYLGLGALSAALCRYGNDLSHETGVTVTTGHALTAWALENLVVNLTNSFRQIPECVSVVGAAGSVGMLCAARLLRSGHPVLLIDVPARVHQLQALCSRFANGSCSTQLADATKSSIVVTATNAPDYLFDISAIPSGTILIDDAQPWCWDHAAAVARFRDKSDILPIEGGLIAAPHVTTIEPHYAEHDRVNHIFGCLAEVMALSTHHASLTPTVGRNAIENLEDRLALSDAYGDVAKNIGLTVAPLQCANHIYSPTELKTFFTTWNFGERSATSQDAEGVDNPPFAPRRRRAKVSE
jgi:predicted amino acid dehydrogenase